jgi:hypothetical protein
LLSFNMGRLLSRSVSPKTKGVSCSQPVAVTLASPDSLQVVPGPLSARLTWRNRSATAEAVAVVRSSGTPLDPYYGSEVTRLPGNATTFVDSLPSPGCYTYRVVAIKTGSHDASSAPQGIVTLPTSTAGSNLDARILVLPTADQILRRADGRWFLLKDTTVLSPEGDGWASHDLWANHLFLTPPWFRLDSRDHPHLVYVTDQIRHSWYDGQAWQDEVVGAPAGMGTLGNGLFQGCLDRQDRMHLLWMVAPWDTSGLRHGYRDADSTWRTEPVDMPAIPLQTMHDVTFQVEAEGRPIILVGAQDSALLVTQEPDGTWTRETVPTGPILPPPRYPLNMLVMAGGEIQVFFNRDREVTNVNLGHEFCMIRKKDGIWSSVQVLVTGEGGGILTRSADGTQAAFLRNPPQGPELWLGRNGLWSASLVDPQINWPTFLFFDAANHVSLLHQVCSPSYYHGPASYVLITEN